MSNYVDQQSSNGESISDRLDMIIKDLISIRVDLSNELESYSKNRVDKIIKKICIVKDESNFIYQDVDFKHFSIECQL